MRLQRKRLVWKRGLRRMIRGKNTGAIQISRHRLTLTFVKMKLHLEPNGHSDRRTVCYFKENYGVDCTVSNWSQLTDELGLGTRFCETPLGKVYYGLRCCFVYPRAYETYSKRVGLVLAEIASFQTDCGDMTSAVGSIGRKTCCFLYRTLRANLPSNQKGKPLQFYGWHLF